MTPSALPADVVSDRRKVRITLWTAGLLAAFLCLPHSGFMLTLVLPPLLIWFCYSILYAIRFPARRNQRLIRIGAWIVAVSTVVVWHAYWHDSARRYADEVAQRMADYMQRHQQCPASLAHVEINQAEFNKRLGLGWYLCRDGEPTLGYAVTYVPFDTYDYDFAHKTWIYRDS